MGKVLLGLDPDPFFDVMTHFGTVLAVLIVFRRDIKEMLLDSYDHLGDLLRFLADRRAPRPEMPDGAKMVLLVVVSSIPAGFLGVFFEDWFEGLFSRPALVSITLFFTGALLLSTRWSGEPKRVLAQFTLLTALLIGLSQALAIIPGISRSGATISAGLFLGLNRDLAGRFAFLMSIPVILGATALKAFDIQMLDNDYLLAVFLGVLASFAFGLVALYCLMHIVRRGKLHFFSFYCMPAALIYGIYCIITGV